jgi:hypothetical protein
MSTLQNKKLIEQLMEEYQEAGGDLDDIKKFIAIFESPLPDAAIINLLKEKIYALRNKTI